MVARRITAVLSIVVSLVFVGCHRSEKEQSEEDSVAVIAAGALNVSEESQATTGCKHT